MIKDEIKSMCCDIYEGGEWEPMVEYILNLQTELQQEKEKRKTLESLLQGNLYTLYLYYRERTIENEEIINTEYISKDKIRDMKRYREFELQQQYKDFENDPEWKTYNKILEEE